MPVAAISVAAAFGAATGVGSAESGAVGVVHDAGELEGVGRGAPKEFGGGSSGEADLSASLRPVGLIARQSRRMNDAFNSYSDEFRCLD